MKLKIPILFVCIMLSLAYPALSAPVITDLTIDPQNLWLGESTFISLGCSNGNLTIDSVYATITGPGMVIPILEIPGSGTSYNITLGESYLDRIGDFDITVFCTSNNQTADTSSNFKISELTGVINEIQPSPGYIGDVVEIYTTVKKDGVDLTSDVDFTVYVDNQEKQLKISPIYDTTKGWVLKIDSPAIPGIYDIKVDATHDRATITNYATIEIKEDIEFDITSIDKTWIKPNDDIYIGLKAQERGSVIDVNKDNLKIEFGPVSAEIESISLSGNIFSIKLKAPHNSPGTYDIKASIEYENTTLTTTEKIYYVVPVSGKFVDSSDKGLSVNLRFVLDGYEKLKLTTNGNGEYSGYIPVDIYDIQMSFPKSTLELEGAEVEEFDDPIRYSRLTGIATQGIINYALYIYEAAIPFDDAVIEIQYNEGDVDETNLKLFKCSIWNTAQNVCKSKWMETAAEIDTIRNIVRLETGTLSAFALGTEERITLNFNMDKSYTPNDPIVIIGVAQDSRKETISNVTLEAGIVSQKIKSKAISDNNGVFTLEFLAPEEEGNYTVYIKAEKNPFIKYDSETEIVIEKSISFSIIFPDSIKLGPNESLTQEIKIINTGQSDIDDLSITVTGIPEEYYSLDSFIGRLLAGKEKTVYIYFSIPSAVDKGTTAAAIEIISTDISREKTFGFTVLEPEKEQEANQTEPITGLATDIPLPKLDEVVYIIIFALASFSAAFLLKRRSKTDNRTEMTSTLSDIKNHLKKETEIIPVVFPKVDDFDMSEYDNYKYG